jgi:hypothetical protein
MTFGIFKQPAVFSVCIYDQPPTGASIEPMSRKVFTLDRAGLAQTYDTSAGVGLSGRMMADVGARGKGMPWWMMIVAVFGILTLLYFVITHGARLLTHSMVKGSPVVARRITDGLATVDKSESQSPEAGEKPLLNRKPAGRETNEVFCVGYFVTPARMQVFLSDGRIADSLDGEVTRVFKRRVEVLGEKFEVRRREPEYHPKAEMPVQRPLENVEPGTTEDHKFGRYDPSNVKIQ